MSDYIKLTKPPTKEDYFKAKIYGMDFQISSFEEIMEFDLIDLEHELPFRISTFHGKGHGYLNMWDIQFKNNIVIVIKKEIGHDTKWFHSDCDTFVYDRKWMKENYLEVYHKVIEVHRRMYGYQDYITW